MISKLPQIFLISLLMLLSMACNKNDDTEVVPSRDWELTYRLTSVADITIHSITYTDELGMPQTVPGEKEFSLSFDVQSGFVAEMIVEATARTGGTIASIEAFALDGSFEQLLERDDDGNASGVPKDFTLMLELTVP